jgi:hypothetical protein
LATFCAIPKPLRSRVVHSLSSYYKVELADYSDDYYSILLLYSTITQTTQNLCPISTKFMGVVRGPVRIVLTKMASFSITERIFFSGFAWKSKVYMSGDRR